MSDVYTSNVYTLKVPSALQSIFFADEESLTDKLLPLQLLGDFKQLAEKLPLTDVFYLIYSQTENDFARYLSQYNILNATQRPENIAFIQAQGEAYENYVRLKEDEKKAKGITTNPNARPFPAHHFNTPLPFQPLHGDFLSLWVEVNPKVAQLPESEAKAIVRKEALRCLGYDIFHRHPLAKYTLAQGGL